ncbi:hypothetical protein QWY85_03190 [Neolewinella lacunae]|uniref:Uncharacterized protein n=1 Tax=Neolewinella lacunae TaxID=1517758 RepID=A0A923PTA2_9BACT|nr:hypothetical protein [Neolewinella lacunae]MBC6996412.1 hypothetical protein [Neolewinella lacunae]MDN3633645.1 hypothetical protein [Neolewinella lacunae]
MYRLSSNATLFLKIFVPVFWTTILAGVTLVAWLAEAKYFAGIPLTSFRWATLFTLVAAVASFWLLLWRLKRVETDGEKVYISNYFRTAFYEWSRDVERISYSRFFLLKVATIELNGVGSFGRKLYFVTSSSLLNTFRTDFPGVLPEEK